MSKESNYYIQPDAEGRQAPTEHRFQARENLTKWCSAHNCAPISNAGNPHLMVPSAQLRVPLKVQIPNQMMFALSSAMI